MGVLSSQSIPSMCSRKPCTKCVRNCSPSVTISIPASSSALSHSAAARRLPANNSSPFSRQGAQSFSGSASQAGLGRLPAMLVSSMVVSPFIGSSVRRYCKLCHQTRGSDMLRLWA